MSSINPIGTIIIPYYSNTFLYFAEEHKAQLLRIFLSTVVLAKVSIEQNAWTISGKRSSANFFNLRRHGSAFVVYLFVLLSRVILITIPLTYLRWSMLIFFVLIFTTNLIFVQCCLMLGANKKKNILTAVVSSFVPVGFVAKREIYLMEKPERRLAKFYMANNLVFSVISLLTLIATNIILHYDMLSNFFMDDCAGMPFTTCHQTWSDVLNGGKYSNHVDFFFYGNLFYISVLLLHLSLSFYFSQCCYNKFYD